MPISDLVLLGAALCLFFLLWRDSILSLSAIYFPSFFVGIVPGFLAAVFHLIGLTWVHGPDCRSLRNRCGGIPLLVLIYLVFLFTLLVLRFSIDTILLSGLTVAHGQNRRSL